MKKFSFAVALPALALSGLLLSGCGMFRSDKAWQNAQQQQPLEIPPGLDTPSATAALVIPPPGSNQPSHNGATARVGDVPGKIVDGFILADSVDNTYRRVGEALSSGDIGTLQGHDDAAHTYTLTVVAAPPTEKRGLFTRMFKPESSDSGAGAKPSQVELTINASGQTSSEIRADGEAGAVAKVVDSLKARLGGKG